MLKNYFKIAFRTLLRNKGYALINILGLAIGIAGAAMLLSYVKDEASFEKFHSKSKQIVRPILIQKTEEGDRFYASNPPIFSKQVLSDLPEVLEETYLIQFLGGQFNLRVNDQRITERRYYVTENSHFSVFDYNFLYGSVENALKNPFEIVLSETKAKALLGSTDVIGELIEAPNIGQFKVVGVFEDLPKNTHLDIDILISHSFSGNRWDQTFSDWTAFGGASYLVLNEGVDLEAFTQKANEINQANLPAQVAEMLSYEFQPLLDVHYESGNIERDMASRKGDKTYSYIFISISLFLVLLAAVNYMNLATSKATFRAKEIGVRKVVGAAKKQIVSQFLMESLILTVVAMVIAIGLIDLSMPFFNQITGKSFDFSLSNLVEYLPTLLSITLLVALLSGTYPAFFMTRMQTVSILKGEKAAGGSFRLRQGLVVFQFVLGIFMIISTLIVGNQMSFIRDKNLGFDQENLVVIDINNGAVRPVFKTMRNELEQIPGVEKVAVTGRVPGEWKNINEVSLELINDEGEARDSVNSYYMSFDPNSLDVFNIKLEQGTYFSGNDASDSTKILINQTAAKTFGMSNPVGQIVNLQTRAGIGPYEIIGVVEDFNFQSLHSNIEPIVIGAWNNTASIIDYFTLKISGDPQSIIEQAGLVHSKFDNRTVMEYHFLDEQLARFYESERQAAIIFKLCAGLSIFIACLGLFGLASFTIQKRIKELGIRKVLGATEWTLFYLLSSSLIKQIFLAFLVASPIAFYFMRNWLDAFQYRTDISIWVFLLAGITTIFVAILTVSYRSFKAAHTNPVNSLRSE